MSDLSQLFGWPMGLVTIPLLIILIVGVMAVIVGFAEDLFLDDGDSDNYA